jgi:hypothetical protein
MNACTRTTCRYCGSSEFSWVSLVLAIWDGAVLRCHDCHRLSLVPVAPRLEAVAPRLEAVAPRLEAVAPRLEAVAPLA